jgi:hypothetical protein
MGHGFRVQVHGLGLWRDRVEGVGIDGVGGVKGV